LKGGGDIPLQNDSRRIRKSVVRKKSALAAGLPRCRGGEILGEEPGSDFWEGGYWKTGDSLIVTIQPNRESGEDHKLVGERRDSRKPRKKVHVSYKRIIIETEAARRKGNDPDDTNRREA